MFELGPRSKEFHHALGIVAAQSGVMRVYATGKHADDVAAGALEAFMKAEDMKVGRREDILADLKAWIRPGDWVLAKGSRAAELEKIVSALVEWAGGDKGKVEG
jgi:UDP-N-acetylmuramoyl-tripeptide--D-alanyl-D-alanine ligase